MTGVRTVLRTLLRLGLTNLARVGAYRLALRGGLHPVQRVAADRPVGPFFLPRSLKSIGQPASKRWRETGLYFGWRKVALVDGVPAWHTNPFSGRTLPDTHRPWWKIPDFDTEFGDIKTVWEPSRFDWLLSAAERAREGDPTAYMQIELWLDGWLDANPPYRGPNWKCGQEVSIRVMHLALAALILGQVQTPCPGLRVLIRLHLARIAPTMAYAIGQQNNHGTSEAAALYIGGSWLAWQGDPAGEGWRDTGLRWLEDRARVLIAPDGTFSQYSVVYHRVMLDTYALAEVWRRRFGLPSFSDTLHRRLSAATRWLYQMTDPDTGDAPNLGANDGARIAALSDTDYRDFRPSVQLAAALFCDARAYAASGVWDQPLIWLEIARPASELSRPISQSFDNGGLHILRQGNAVAYLRYPRFRFRPSQADALHLDLWVDGANVLRDAGTFSYNVYEVDTAYFNGTGAHNTVQFDGRDQMPRLGRFLFGAWLKARDVRAVFEDAGTISAAAGYRDHWGARHHRDVRLAGNGLICTDRLAGTAARAVLRWRLIPGEWQLSGSVLTNGTVRLAVSSDQPIARIALTEGAESRFYLQKTPLPVLEVETSVPATLKTEIFF